MTEAPSKTAAKHWPAVALFLGVTLVMLAADLVSKELSFRHVAGEPVVLTPDNLRQAVPPHDSIAVVPYVLSLHLTVNQGAVFGIGQGQRWMFIAISVIAIAVIGTIFLRSSANDWPNHLAWALILSGALGNLYDRMRFGGVRDMLHLFPDVHLPFGWSWPMGSTELYPWIFNIADVALVCGVALVILVSFRRERARKNG